ncbi:hypothetical protein [Methanosarcina mazei]|uniref:hypothetical protein n=1 Tax=Methanosarcina mazei TaxID=2209 RepID=UPI00064E19D9|nr:hypothetical protein [Methanosarcina mazei]
MIGNLIIGFVASFFMVIFLPDEIMNGALGNFILIGLFIGITALTYYIFPNSNDFENNTKIRMYNDGKTVTTVAVYPDDTEQIISESNTADYDMIQKYNASHEKKA